MSKGVICLERAFKAGICAKNLVLPGIRQTKEMPGLPLYQNKRGSFIERSIEGRTPVPVIIAAIGLATPLVSGPWAR